MKVMQLCLGPGLGGLELYVYRTSLKLSQTDDVIAVISENGKLAKKFSDTDIPVMYLEKGFKALPLIKARKLAKIIDDNDVDVIHMHWARDLSLAAFAKYFSRKKPRLVYTRQMQITRSKQDIYHRFLYNQVDVFITITQVLADLSRKFLGQKNADKVVPLYYGVQEPDRYLTPEEKHHFREKMGFSDTDFVVALFGRIEEYKGQYVLIDTIAELEQRGETIKGLIVGHAMDERYLQSLKQRAVDANIEGNICFMDFVENPQQWMQASDVVLLATKEETFGLVLAEAMHAGVPVIGTNSGGVPEIIEHGKTGLMFDFGDVEGLAGCILELKNDPEKRTSFARAGQQKAQALFSLASHYKSLRAILKGETS